MKRGSSSTAVEGRGEARLSGCVHLDELCVDPLGSSRHFLPAEEFLVVLAGQPEEEVLFAVLCPQELLKQQLTC